MKIVSLVGARPQFVKEALVGQAARESGAWDHVLVHSGQHYDPDMSDVFFKEFGMPRPQHHLGVGSGSHGAMTAAVLAAMEEVLLAERPQALMVYGDTNTTLAGALAAAKLRIPIIHIEAGIRQKPRDMPEEINRVLTDHLASRLLCCSSLGARNLAAENIRQGVHVAGDIMLDVFLRLRPRFAPAAASAARGVVPGGYFVATLHRDFNVDRPEPLSAILTGLSRLSASTGMPVLLCLHPRTRQRMERFDLIRAADGLVLLPPVGYIELMSLVCASAAVLTDSGGLQKEAYYAGRRAVVLMPDTGWRELIECGFNLLCPPEADRVVAAGQAVLAPVAPPPAVYGCGETAAAIVTVAQELLSSCS
ncbi:non-hydrolyzing UDP-N-acetylglucosamine 2-epimerase [Desulfolutivibrio sulfoxidireducens]|uniref:non-hydrolyzing UDP-N-acetylglucosamine 2-epimerase n=1 Tax=Desulfolutivibrio sulfoxidireducens TaxID=2773299 RepID=UPI00159E93D5|nr:UDP-N-acetylglucosamine 2-epimerase (non-hydrolyzing) [Desulfolutivibrio sulfoxidireducens]QLA20003.1 UDP-N-acetylglucosamine 2-epimerase (non-hydrolyzing) [Desulfolutivibrio sulfoxidireducens]